MKTITCDEMVKLADQYAGKQVEISLSPFPIQSNNTYQHFRLNDVGDELKFYDINIDKPTPHELKINKKDIKEILYFGSNTYDSVFCIKLENGEIEFTVIEKPVHCVKCRKLIDTPYEQSWNLNQMGSYYSQYDMERITLNLCDDCLCEIIGYEDNKMLLN